MSQDWFRMSKRLQEIDTNSLTWKPIKEDGLDLEYAVVIPRSIANNLFNDLENTIEYFTGDLAKIRQVYANA